MNEWIVNVDTEIDSCMNSILRLWWYTMQDDDSRQYEPDE